MCCPVVCIENKKCNTTATSRKKGKEVCATLFIRAVVLEEMVLLHLQYITSFVTAYSHQL